MSTVREKIIDALTLFWAKISTVLVRKANIVDNCASTSTEYPLSANQGTQLQSQIDELNSNLETILPLHYLQFGCATGTAIVAPFDFNERCILICQFGTIGSIYSAYKDNDKNIQLAEIVPLSSGGKVFVNSGGYLAFSCDDNYAAMRCNAFYD